MSKGPMMYKGMSKRDSNIGSYIYFLLAYFLTDKTYSSKV